MEPDALNSSKIVPDLGVLIYSDREISETVELAQLSESLGYKYFWYTDVRFARECYIGLTSVALATKKILVATGVTDPYSRHPAITAAAIATLDEISNGRAVLGLGAGGAGFNELGLKAHLPIAAMREAIEIIRGLFRGETVTKNGKIISIDGGALSFKPYRSKVPIFIATHGLQMSYLAGRIADGMWIANTLNPSALQMYLDKIDQGLNKENRSEESLHLGLRVEACISSDTEQAINIMRRRVAGRIMGQYPHWDYLKYTGLTLPEEFLSLGGSRDEDVLDKATKLIPQEIVDSMALSGDSDRVASLLRQALHPKITQVTLRPHAVPGEKLATVIQSFKTEVIPKAQS